MDEYEDRNSSNEPSISDVLKRFTAHMDSLTETIEPMMFAISKVANKTRKDIMGFEKKYGEVEEIENGKRIHFFSEKHLRIT